jgi:EAL domain-containing protein (putative c-di-GMP-specific phosphodiesterase class I)
VDTLPSLFERIMAPGQITTLFQPIVRFDGNKSETYGLEALTRGPEGTNLERADVFFEYMRRKRKEDLADLICIKSSIRQAAALPSFGRLFVNVHASTLAKNQRFVDSLEALCSLFSFRASGLVIEVVEHTPYWNREEFLRSTRRLRELGAHIAVDDLGVAYSSFKVILDVNPDYLKIDMYITRGCYRDRVRQSMIESFIAMGASCGAQLIAEGIEDERELELLKSLGLNLFQGYLLARPQPASRLTTSFIHTSSTPSPTMQFLPLAPSASFGSRQ